MRAARHAGLKATGSDIVVRSRECAAAVDFLKGLLTASTFSVPTIVSNPPFHLADEFARVALMRAESKVALLLPAKWLSADKRSRWLAGTPLRRVYLLTPRPSMPPGPVIEAGIKPGNGTADFCWVVWKQGFIGTPEMRWLRRNGDA